MLCLEPWPNDWPGNHPLEAGTIQDFDGVTYTSARDTLECHNLAGHGLCLPEASRQLF